MGPSGLRVFPSVGPQDENQHGVERQLLVAKERTSDQQRQVDDAEKRKGIQDEHALVAEQQIEGCGQKRREIGIRRDELAVVDSQSRKHELGRGEFLIAVPDMEIARGRKAPRHHMIDPFVHAEVSAGGEDEGNDERGGKKQVENRVLEGHAL